MKTKNFLFTILLLTVFSISTIAQTQEIKQNANVTSITETFKVWGKCNMCKSRIEKTVLTKGVSKASWDGKTQLLTVTFDPSVTNKDEMSKKLASVGHDTEKYKAPDDVYAKLPMCCHYERAK